MVTADELMALASLAGQTIVTAAVTDAWETCRRKIAKVFGRGDPDRARRAEQRLDETHQQLTGSEGADLEQIRAQLAAQWTGRLADMLYEYPAAEAELREAVAEIQAALPTASVSAADRSVAAGRDVRISGVKADRGGFAAGIFTGDVVLPDPPGREPEPG